MSTKGLVYYTDNTPEERLFEACQTQLKRVMEQWGFPIYSVSHKPIDLGTNIVVDFKREAESIFKQALIGIEACKTDYIFLIEHDVLYHPSHFDFVPPWDDTFYYNRNMWNVSSVDGRAVHYKHDDLSHCCASRDIMLKHFTKVVEYQKVNGFQRRLGFSPPKGLPRDQRIARHDARMSEFPNINVRHPHAFTRQRMTKDQFSSDKACRDWTESDSVPVWGKTLGRFDELLTEILNGTFRYNSS